VGVGRTIFCWGLDVEGRQFAAASGPTRRSFAVESPTVGVSNARVVTAGEAHSCMLTMGGIAYCSGNNERGQIGSGTVSASSAPAQPDFLLGRPATYSGIATGERHTCGIPRFNPGDLAPLAPPIKPSQRVWCWGANDAGQLGNATFRDTSFADTVVVPPAIRALIPAVTGFDSTSIVAGASHTCVLEAGAATADRRAFCWGNNSFGQLGKGIANDTVAHNDMRLVANGAFVKLYAGENHTCGLTSTGVASCWGRNDRGQISGAAIGTVVTPTQVGGTATFRALALGELFTCGIVGNPLQPGGTSAGASQILCWGDNEFGQLGRGLFSPSGHAPLGPLGIFGQ
jgi:alpha-tubulin suppressor-like RCC1 family protein